MHSTATTSSEMAARFVAEYVKTYGYRDESPIELVKLRVVGRGLREQPARLRQLRSSRAPARRPARARASLTSPAARPAVETEIVPRAALSARRRGAGR